MKVMARLMAVILILVTLLSFVPMQAAAADYINVASVASTYGISSGTAAYTALSMINNTYASQLTTAQKQGIVVFMFEGAGNDLTTSKRMGAMCVVVKNGSVAYLNRNCSTIPDYPFNPAQNEGTDMPTLKSGIYSFSTVNHLSSYAALNVNSAQVVRHSSKTSYYSSTSSGINVHRRSSDTIPSTSAGWVNSAGCLIIGKTGTSATGEYAKFIQAIGIVGSGAAGNSKYTTSKTGKIVVDRSLAGSYLSGVGYSSGALSLLGSVDESQPPTKSTISISKTTYAVNEEVIFNMSCSGATNTLWVYRVDGQWQNHYENAGSSYPLAFGWEGEYKALVETWNSKGSKISNEVYFTVGSGGTTTTTTTKPTTTATTTATTKPASSDKPTSATISVNKSSVEPEENITLTFSGNGKSNTLWVYFPNGTSRYYQNAGTSRTMAFANPGVYYALVETWNAAGTESFISQKISFTVTPTTAKVTASKSSVTTGENVTFTMSTNGKINDLWIYYPDGTSKAYQNAGSSKTLSFTTAGTYQALVQTWNTAATFNVISEKITFTVTNKTTTATTTKATTTATTTKTTTATTTKTTTTSTTKATTATTTTKPTTTAPTTASVTTQTATASTTAPTTTKPTTVHTTQPNTIIPTVSTVIYDCAVYGHDYVNGWCRICKEKDPEYVAPTTESVVPVESTTTSPVLQNQTTSSQNGNADANNGGMKDGKESGDDFSMILIWIMIAVAVTCILGALILIIYKKKK